MEVVIIRIIFLIAAVFGIYWGYKKISNKITKNITYGASIAIFSGFIPVPLLSYILSLLILIVFLIYCLYKDQNYLNKIIFLFLILPVILQKLFSLMHYPYTLTLKYLCYLTIIMFLAVLFFRRKEFRDEMGLNTIVFVESLNIVAF